MKLAFFDIDGTLLPVGWAQPPRSAVEAMQAFRDAGNRLFLCTGRSLCMCSSLLELGCFDGAVTSAGGYVFAGDTVLNDCPMTEQDRETALRALRGAGVYCVLEGRDATYYDERLDERYRRADETGEMYAEWARIRELFGYLPSAQYHGETLYKVFFFFEDPVQLAPCREVLKERYRFVLQERFGGPLGTGEIISLQFSKGDGVRRIAEYCGVPLRDTIGFGDSMNDLEMMQTTGISVCMEDGSESLKPYCTLIAPPAEQDGIAAVLRQLT